MTLTGQLLIGQTIQRIRRDQTPEPVGPTRCPDSPIRRHALRTAPIGDSDHGVCIYCHETCIWTPSVLSWSRHPHVIQEHPY